MKIVIPWLNLLITKHNSSMNIWFIDVYLCIFSCCKKIIPKSHNNQPTCPSYRSWKTHQSSPLLPIVVNQKNLKQINQIQAIQLEMQKMVWLKTTWRGFKSRDNLANFIQNDQPISWTHHLTFWKIPNKMTSWSLRSNSYRDVPPGGGWNNPLWREHDRSVDGSVVLKTDASTVPTSKCHVWYERNKQFTSHLTWMICFEEQKHAKIWKQLVVVKHSSRLVKHRLRKKARKKTPTVLIGEKKLRGEKHEFRGGRWETKGRGFKKRYLQSLGGSFKYFLFSSLFGEDYHFD